MMSQSVVRCLLDSNMYPHIMDNIVASAPDASLIRLRATCRELHRQCDKLLSRHFVVRNGKTPSSGLALPRFPITICTPTTRHPLFYDFNPYLPEFYQPRGAWTSAPQDFALHASEVDPRRAAARNARVLDFVGPIPYVRRRQIMDLLGPETDAEFPSSQGGGSVSSNRKPLDPRCATLRVRPDATGGSPWSQPPGAPIPGGITTMYVRPFTRLVVFEHLNGAQKYPVAYTHTMERALPPLDNLRGNGVPTLSSLSGVRRLVVNYIMTGEDEVLQMPIFEKPPATVREVVVIFQLRGERRREIVTPTRPTLANILGETPPPVHPDMFRTIEDIGLTLPEVPGRTLKIVNLAAVNPIYFLRSPNSDEQVQQTVQDVIQGCMYRYYGTLAGVVEGTLPGVVDGFEHGTPANSKSPHERSLEMMVNLEFLTMDEYRDSVPPEQFAIETVEGVV